MHNRILVACVSAAILVFCTVFMVLPVLCSKHQVMFSQLVRVINLFSTPLYYPSSLFSSSSQLS